MAHSREDWFVGKLVRDGIPDSIRASGREPELRVLTDDEYLASLFQKLAEETDELQEADEPDRLEEMADVYEVLRALAAATGHSMIEVERAAEQKKASRGGFDQRVWLVNW